VPETRLLIDMGNTRLKWIWASGDELDAESAASGDFDTFRNACRVAAADRPDSVLLSSVAGEEPSRAVVRFCAAHWGARTQILKSRPEQGGVRNAYGDPEALGVDRWLAIVGAVSRHGKPVVVWDLGTATTLDAVDPDGRHLGGLILPGPETMLRSLRRETRLQVPEELRPDECDGTAEGVAPGLNTSSAIRNGVFAAQLGALNQFLRNLGWGGERSPLVVATGGAAEAVLARCHFEYRHDPWLVFRGMLVE
jgi:type III pantothenate kinase